MPRPPDSGTHSKPRVLLVEDDEDTREMYAWCLRAAGWIVEAAADGAEALVSALVFEPDVIVMDLCLPVVDGLEAARQLKASEMTRGIPIVACSAFDIGQADALARQAGCEGFVAKPCSPDDLCILLENVVRRGSFP
jgi:CheY-like chemotaxis protein